MRQMTCMICDGPIDSLFGQLEHRVWTVFMHQLDSGNEVTVLDVLTIITSSLAMVHMIIVC